LLGLGKSEETENRS